MHPYVHILPRILLGKSVSAAVSRLEAFTIYTIFYFQVLKSKRKRKKKKELWLPYLLVFSFYILIFSETGWQTQGCDMSKKRYERVLGSLCFLKCHFFLSVFKANSMDSKGKCGFLELPAVLPAESWT